MATVVRNTDGPIELVTLDDALKTAGTIDLIRIDVEGRELAVLRGAHETFAGTSANPLH